MDGRICWLDWIQTDNLDLLGNRFECGAKSVEGLNNWKEF